MSKVSKQVGRVSVPGRRFTAKRNLYPGNPAALEEHCQRLGEVIHAYNSAHAGVYLIFYQLSSRDSHNAPAKLWHTFGGDKGQREFAINYVSDNKSLSKTLKKAIIWGISSLGELSVFRNDVAHAEMLWYYEQLEPGMSTKSNTRERLSKSPFDKHWRPLKGDLSALSNYFTDLSLDVMTRRALPSCKRPRLQLVQQTPEKNQAKRRLAKKKARELQRLSSQP